MKKRKKSKQTFSPASSKVMKKPPAGGEEGALRPLSKKQPRDSSGKIATAGRPRRFARLAGCESPQPDSLFEKTQALIQKVESKIDGRLICYWISGNGSICMNDVSAIYEILETIGYSKNLYLFIKSDGGNGRASLRMVNLIRKKCRKFHALIPLNCESAATMLVLGADSIQMGPMSFLTPVDTSIRHDLSPIDKEDDRVSIGTNELERIVAGWKRTEGKNDENVYKELYKYIHPLAIAAVDRAGSLSNMLCDEIMSYHIGSAAIRRRISRILNSDYPSHSYPIVLKEARRIGIKAIELPDTINEDLVELNEVYAEICKRCRTDFSPLHYHDNEVLNVIECYGKMIYYKLDKEWHFTESDKVWRYTNEKSTYRCRTGLGENAKDMELHVR